MTAILEFLGKPAEAPAAVPGSVHEHKPCHRASIHHSMLGHIPTANAKQSEDRRVRCASVLSLEPSLVAFAATASASLFVPERCETRCCGDFCDGFQGFLVLVLLGRSLGW